jgi:hypothetical protein
VFLACTPSYSACNAILGIEGAPPGSPSPRYDDEVDAGQQEAGVLDAGPDDGGVAMPPARYSLATWPMPDSDQPGVTHPLSYRASTADVVDDQVTGLSWQRGTAPAPVSWEEAREYCSALTLDGARFRLPTRIELLSLLKPSTVPAIDLEAFPASPSEPFWSASPFASRRASAWAVDFGYGASKVFGAPLGERLGVRCVKDVDQADWHSDPPAVDNGTVTYARTEATWQLDDSPRALDWTGARDYCAALALDGGGWRLPTLKELHLLVDEARARPALQAGMKSREVTERIWSSTALLHFPGSAWALNVADGSDAWFPKETLLKARCIR